MAIAYIVMMALVMMIVYITVSILMETVRNEGYVFAVASTVVSSNYNGVGERERERERERENYKNILTNNGKRQNNDYLTIYV